MIQMIIYGKVQLRKIKIRSTKKINYFDRKNIYCKIYFLALQNFFFTFFLIISPDGPSYALT